VLAQSENCQFCKMVCRLHISNPSSQKPRFIKLILKIFIGSSLGCLSRYSKVSLIVLKENTCGPIKERHLTYPVISEVPILESNTLN
jgi:hypothetical protein